MPDIQDDTRPQAGRRPGACEISIVVPVLNEETAIPAFCDAVFPVLDRTGLPCEIIFVDDGSSDRTAEVVLERAKGDQRIKLVQLSRAFGKEAAMTAGLDWAQGAAAIPMDVDLQDPPELITEFVRLWREEGYDIVIGQRRDRSSDTALKRLSAGWFYRTFNALSASPLYEHAGDYRLLDRTALQATLRLRERNRFMKGILSWAGFRVATVPFERPPRSTGEGKFNYWKLWNFALDGLTSFTTLPLRLWTYVGLGVAIIAIVYTIVIILGTLFGGNDVPGYASLMVVMLLLGAVQLISLGIMGEYLGRIYQETKARPIYVVRSAVGFPATEGPRDTDDVPPARVTVTQPEVDVE